MKSHDQQHKSHDQDQTSHDQHQVSHDRHQTSRDQQQKKSRDNKRQKSREHQQNSCDRSVESCDSRVTKTAKKQSRKRKEKQNPAAVETFDGSQRVNGIDGSQRVNGIDGLQRVNGIDGSQRVNGIDGLQRVNGIDGSQRVKGGENGRSEGEKRGEKEESSADTDAPRERDATDSTGQPSEVIEGCGLPVQPSSCSSLTPLEVVTSSDSVMMSSVDGGSCSGSDASPQSSVCSNSSHPQTPPILSSPSHSPSPSTPSQHRSPSPDPCITTETNATDTVTTETNEGTQEWPILEPITVNDNDDREAAGHEDEWPDLHSPEVKLQQSEFFTNSRSNGEVRVQNVEPHPHNAAAAYPLMVHPLPPYSVAGRVPHILPHMQHIPTTTTGSFNYYSFHPHQQTGFTSYYPLPGPGQFAWQGSHVGLPHHPVPVPYSYSGSENNDSSGCVDSDKTPPTIPGDVEGELDEENVEERHERELEEDDRLREGDEGGEERGEAEEREVVEEGEGEEERVVEKEEEVDGVCEGVDGEGGEVCGEEKRDFGEEEEAVDPVSDELSPNDIAPVPPHYPLEFTW